jgi:hypothetical protein
VTTAVSFFGSCGSTETPTTETPPVETPSAEPVANILLTDFETPFDEDDSNYTNYLHVDTYWNRLTTGSKYTEYFTWADEAYGTAMRLISGDGWEGPVWRKGVELGFKTDTFKVKGKGKPFTTKTVQIYLWIFLGNMEEGTGGREEILMTVDYDNAVDLGNGWFDYTITISKKVSVIHGFEFKVVADSYFIDDLRAINTSK